MEDLPGATPPESDNFDACFVIGAMPDPFRRETVRRALEWRGQASGNARGLLEQTIRDGFAREGVSVAGFRNAGRAPALRLLDPVEHYICHWNGLAAAVFLVWMESQPELRDGVFNHLESAGVPTQEFDPFNSPIEFIPADSLWYDARASYMEAYPDSDEEEVFLMFSLASGMIDFVPDDFDGNGDPSLEMLLAGTHDILSQLPPHAPEWEDMIPDFIARLSQLVQEKEQERNRAAALDNLLAELKAKFQELLDFFQWNPRNWTSANAGDPLGLGTVEYVATELDALLGRYALVHDRGTTAADELDRSRQRAELLPQILETGGKLEEMMTPWDDGQGEAHPALLPNPGPKDEEASNSLPDVVGDTAEVTSLEAPPQPAGEETDLPEPEGFAEIQPCEIEDYLLLRLELAELQKENDDLEREVKSLEKALFESRSKEEGYWYAQASQEGTGAQTTPDVTDVNAAVALARDRFDRQLIFRLNSDSSIEGNQFKWPDKIWSALEWLATTYYDARTGKTQNTDLDASCRLASDMWYKTSQHETTMTSYRNSYTTKVDGRTIWLQEHIGKGTSFDPRRTIRIAFDWDRDLRKVIVGYIGQHQRTSST